jgi:hypothetical protein
MKSRRVCLLLLASAAAMATAQPEPSPKPAAPAAPAGPAVEKIDATHFRLGEITFDSRTRQIRFPATVNMTQNPLEFLIVHKNGKVHESLLKTGISPLALNLALTLLRYQPSPELYSIPTSDSDPTAKFPAVPAATKKAARLTLTVEWQDDAGALRKVPLNDWVQHTTNGSTMPAGPLVYGDPEITDGKFPPEATGDIAAIYLSQSALINYPGQDNDNDDVWIPYPKRVPPLDSKVTVIITPYQP